MPGRFLIDVTDARFFIPPNEDVLAFVRRANPFAHSDVGSLLIALGKELPGAHAYCPSYRSCAYVVLHTDADRIFAIAFGQRGLAFRLAAPARLRRRDGRGARHAGLEQLSAPGRHWTG